MATSRSANTDPADWAVVLLQRVRELLIECRAVAGQLEVAPGQESEAAAAERMAYGALVASLEEGLVTTLQHAMEVLRRFGTPAGVLGEQWLSEQEKKLGRGRALMVPPVWLDESGQPRAVRQCSRCGRDAPVYRFRLEHLRLIGWRLYAPAEYVNWCGHIQEFIPLPGAEGWCRLTRAARLK
jgi:hypothetical protein